MSRGNSPDCKCFHPAVCCHSASEFCCCGALSGKRSYAPDPKPAKKPKKGKRAMSRPLPLVTKKRWTVER